jgi:hypothetical protein
VDPERFGESIDSYQENFTEGRFSARLAKHVQAKTNTSIIAKILYMSIIISYIPQN